MNSAYLGIFGGVGGGRATMHARRSGLEGSLLGDNKGWWRKGGTPTLRDVLRRLDAQFRFDILGAVISTRG